MLQHFWGSVFFGHGVVYTVCGIWVISPQEATRLTISSCARCDEFTSS